MIGRVHRQFEFGKTAVADALPAWIGGAASSDIVITAVAAIQPGGVEGDEADAAATRQAPPDRNLQQAANPPEAQQADAGFLQGGEVGHVGQADGSAKIGQVAEPNGNAAIIEFEEGLEDETAEELGLGVEFGTAFTGVRPQGLAADGQGFAGDVGR